jgi:hypothetical protein
MRRPVGIAAGVIGAALIATVAVSCDDSTGPDDDEYTAVLSASSEVPPNSTAGTGVVTFEDNGDHIEWTMELTNMSAVFASHIHGPAPVGVNAPVMFNLFIPNTTSGTLNGTVGSGTITNANNVNVSLDSLRTLFNNGNAYVNVHTTPFQAGAIRGQVVPD